jgi:hypothetical protein
MSGFGDRPLPEGATISSAMISDATISTELAVPMRATMEQVLAEVRALRALVLELQASAVAGKPVAQLPPADLAELRTKTDAMAAFIAAGESDLNAPYACLPAAAQNALVVQLHAMRRLAQVMQAETVRPDAVLTLTPQPHQVRVLTEKRDLSTKLAGLRAFLEGGVFPALPSEEREAMLRQLEAMQQYEYALGDRLRLWGLS